MNAKIKRGDTVVVITGKDKGKKGKVLMVSPEDGTVLVDGVNMVIKHKKARSAQQKSAREKKAGAIQLSNVMVLCKCGKTTRVAMKIVNDKKVRSCKKCGEILDKKFVRAKEKEKAVDAEIEKKDDKKAEKTPLKRREVKATADSKVTKSPSVKSSVALPRKMGSS